MEREVRYCTSADGTRIAYCEYGEGPVLVRCPANWESLNDEVEEGNVYQHLDRGRAVVRYDFRGVGLSQRDATEYTLDRMTQDIEAVVASIGVERFSLSASTFSVGPAIAYAVRHPDKVARLILARGFVRGG